MAFLQKKKINKRKVSQYKNHLLSFFKIAFEDHSFSTYVKIFEKLSFLTP